MYIAGGDHLDVPLVVQGNLGTVLLRGSIAVADHLQDGVVVADDQAVKAPLLPQKLDQQLPVTIDGNAVQGVEGGHDHVGLFRHAGLVAPEVVLPQGVLAHVGGVVVPSALRRAVGREVLHAAGNTALVVAPHIGLAHHAAEVRILAGGLHHPAPAGVAHQIRHGREGHMHAVGPCFIRSHHRAFLHQVGVEGAGHGQVHRVYGAVAVDHVLHQQEGHIAVPVMGAVGGQRRLRAGEVQRRAHAVHIRLGQTLAAGAAGHGGVPVGTDGGDRHLRQLPGLVRQSHPGNPFIQLLLAEHNASSFLMLSHGTPRIHRARRRRLPPGGPGCSGQPPHRRRAAECAAQARSCTPPPTCPHPGCGYR